MRIGCVAGFLGAGKTAAIGAAVRELAARGLRAAVITNDQGRRLVDAEILRGLGVPVAEVAGGCFCCRFAELVDQIDRIDAAGGGPLDLVLAEAVGSCADLAATVYAPLRRFFPDRFELAPLSVLVDPIGARERLAATRPPWAGAIDYLFDRQLAEADLVLLTKTDLFDDDDGDGAPRQAARAMLRARLGDVPVVETSAVTGDGISAWVDRLLGGAVAGGRPVPVDYDRYARAEAALGWLNATVDVSGAAPVSPRAVGGTLIDGIRDGCRAGGHQVAHVKVLVATADGGDRISLTRTEGEARWSGDADLPAARELSVIVNARVEADPDALRATVGAALASTATRLGARVTPRHLECFSPARPVPQHRLAGVVPLVRRDE